MALFDKTMLDFYMNLPIPGNMCQVMYCWIDGTGQALRSKTRTLDFIPETHEDLPIWNFDGSSTGQAEGKNSDVYLHPVAMYRDPFRRGNNKIVLCETYTYDQQPTKTNFRQLCVATMRRAEQYGVQIGMEQEYVLYDTDNHPYGWPKQGYPGPQGKYHCAVGAGVAFGRDVIEAHYRVCLYSDIEIFGSNAESMPSQWEFQIGTTEGIRMCDDLWMARYFLERVAEDFNIVVSWDPKPVTGDWNGSGLHANFSTTKTRGDNGLQEIEKAIKSLEKTHIAHIRNYAPNEGLDNEKRLLGSHEASSMYDFTYGVADRTVSVRIPRAVSDAKRGYLEDRRPAANADPYVVSDIMLKTICFNERRQSLRY